MGRIKLALPDAFHFCTQLVVRITDLNYGGHVGNDTILSFIHQARVSFLATFGYTELNFSSVGLIMSDVAIVYKKELFYPSELSVEVGASDFTSTGFDLFYRLQTGYGETLQVIAEAKTGMVCFDYGRRKVCMVPEEARQRLMDASFR